ncbi:transmembrane protein, putative [Bodo saltans]|uniref:Transmembrane protein, putative n=1 Tax=Bodo saltans TaxID=75058 RepID=A0A0S4JBE0_BODSA|nr:transmembrane protein, putative [Bodo saltans]|eukprot:CUG87259.1 transmembrane protein, putative [Bodo saltans]
MSTAGRADGSGAVASTNTTVARTLLNRRSQPRAAADGASQQQPTIETPRADTAAAPTGGASPKLRRGKSRRNLLATAAAAADTDETLANNNNSNGVVAGAAAAFPVSYDNREEDETARLLYDPENPEALRAIMEQLKIGSGDQRVIFEPEIEMPPAWVHRWNELRLYSNHSAANVIPHIYPSMNSDLPSAGTVLQCLETCRLRLQMDVMAAQQLRSEVQIGIDGGMFGTSCKQVETPHRHPGDPFWTEVGAAERYSDDLIRDLQKSLQLCEDALRLHREQHPSALHHLPPQTPGLVGADGYMTDGSQHRLLCPAAVEAQHAVAKRIVMEFITDSNGQWGRKGAGPDGRPQTVCSRTDAGISRLFNDVPVIHDHFVIDRDVSRIMDPLAIRDPDMLSSPQTIADAHSVPLYRSYTIHVPFLRFRDDAHFSREQQYASQLLDAYEQYQLLTANLKPELKSRLFYRQILSTLEVQQQVHALSLAASVGGATAFSVYQESASAMHEREAYIAQQQQQSAVIRDLYLRSVEAERSCLYQMVSSWRQLSAVRDAQGFRTVRLTLAMRRHGASSGGVASGGGTQPQQLAGLEDPSLSSNDILHYVPVLTDSELHPMPFSNNNAAASPAQQQRVAVSPTDATLAPSAFPQQQPAVPQQHLPLVLPPHNMKARNFSISVFARTSTTLPPKFVGSTAPRPLNTTATAHINETFELRTQHDPTEIILQIVREEDKQVISSVRIPASTSQAALLLPFTTGAFFTDPETGEAKQECGLVSVATTWTTSEGQSIEAIERMFLRGEADPLDPRNEKFVQLLRKYYTEASPADGAGAGGDKQGFRQGEGGLYLPLPAALGARHELLRRRWLITSREDCAVDELEAKLVDQAVPLEDNQVKRLYRELKKQVDAAKAIAASQAAVVSGQSAAGGGANFSSASAQAAATAEEQRNLQRHQLWQQGIKNVKLMHRSRRRLADHEKLAKHLVLPPLPTFLGVFQYLIDNLSPQSNFNPRRENRQNAVDIDRTKLLGGKGGSANIVVHVMKAANLPTRDEGTELEPQVEASFVSFNACGRSEAGSNPSWFESLKIRFEPPDFEEDTLSLIDDMIVISVYDRLRISLPPATATLGATPEIVHYRIERRLLGTVKIPFYTLYTAKKASLEGLYTLVTPRWIMGYHVPRGAPSTLQLYVALNPPLCSERRPQPCLVSDLTVLPVAPELHQIHWLAFQWRERVAEILAQTVLFENPNAVWRHVDPFVPNAVGDPTLICRYILPRGGPPPLTVTSVPAAIRFVALQHFEVDMVTWGDRDVWSTNAEFLAKGKGDYEELALLLVHLLRHLAPHSHTYLLMGKGDHYHQAAFVLHVVNGDWKIIDPRTGNLSDAHDPHCELAEVSMVVSHDQVYANVQLSGTPYRMIWDINDQRYWVPMLPPNLPPELQQAMLEPLQREHLVFKPPLESQAMIIEDNLKKCVKKALKTWRNDRQPPYQERVGTILREVLEELERERRECANYQQNSVDEVHRKALNEFEGEYVAIGNPVCAPYRPDDNFANILDAVFETAVHRVGTDSVRYGLATYAFPFSETTVVMWVYLVALVPRRNER